MARKSRVNTAPPQAKKKDLTDIFNVAIYIRLSVENNGKEELNIKCAGMPDRIKERLREEDFYEGAEYEGNLKARTVPGGVILAEVTYKIKKA